MARTLLQAFDDEFSREIPRSRSQAEAYDRAHDRFYKQHGFEPFKSYDSFRKKKERGRKK